MKKMKQIINHVTGYYDQKSKKKLDELEENFFEKLETFQGNPKNVSNAIEEYFNSLEEAFKKAAINQANEGFSGKSLRTITSYRDKALQIIHKNLKLDLTAKKEILTIANGQLIKNEKKSDNKLWPLRKKTKRKNNPRRFNREGIPDWKVVDKDGLKQIEINNIRVDQDSPALKEKNETFKIITPNQVANTVPLNFN
jgi:hypothetical protein